MGTHLDQRLLGEICTIKCKNEILVGQIIEIKDEQFSVKLLEAKDSCCLDEWKQLKISIETMDQKIHLLDAEMITRIIEEQNTIILLKPISDIQFHSKRQGPRLPVTTQIEILYRIFPPVYHSWKKGTFFNIGVGGAQFIGDMYISIGDLMEVKLGAPFFDEEEVVICRIVHATSEEGKYTFSVQFLNLQDNHKQQLQTYIENTLTELRK